MSERLPCLDVRAETLPHATARNVLWLSAEEMVTGLNRVLIGWANYYSLGLLPAA
ncbi:MAG: group II intron maturase-specific domain-containing protein [Rhodoplanes sp.]